MERMVELDKEKRLYFPKKKDGRIMKKVYLNELKGQPMTDTWIDINPLSAHASERLGYPTQKPLELLERIIQASSNEGDLVLDPFCGCGTTIAAAHKLKRRWVGIDITHLSISLQKFRLRDMFDISAGTDYEVIGEPTTVSAAHDLAEWDRYQFQWWALSLVEAKPVGGEAGSKRGKKGADKGIDGIINFIDEAGHKPKKVVIQVKSGHVKSGDIRDLKGTVERAGEIGVFITLEPPTRPMTEEAVSAGFYESPGWNKKFPKIQILTIEDLLNGQSIDMPPGHDTFRKAQRVKQEAKSQAELEF